MMIVSLSFYIMQDRWDYKTYGHRSIEDLKDRYYHINNVLTKLRKGEEAKLIVYDAEHEKKRREQLRKLWGRSPEQVEDLVSLLSDLMSLDGLKDGSIVTIIENVH
jgi:DNA methyltransferase 1-associated protein 1